MTSPLSADTSLDGYQLIRFLGRGGFGEVWLCLSRATGSYHALKFISGSDSDLIEKEHHALGLYRSAAAKLHSAHLVPIEHINRHEGGLYYVMPLADGISASDPAEPDWQPLSLAAWINARAEAPTWFSSREIIDLMTPLLEALQTLSDAGLVHRDVKPENILFFNGSPCLGDISLLGEDAAVITRRGTPGYATPSWYRGGLPDMYGAAATLYSLLTGNPPDKMGRAAFLWPPQGEQSLPEAERAEWKRLHSIIRRATDEHVGERYVDFHTMSAAVSGAAVDATNAHTPQATPRPGNAKKRTIVWTALAALGVLLVIGLKILPAPAPGDASDGSQRPDLTLPQFQPEDPALPSEQPTAATPSTAHNVAYEDAQAASISLLKVHLPYESPTEDHQFLLATASAIQSLVMDREAFQSELAVQKLDECLATIEALQKIPNVLLARLLLIQASGGSAQVADELDNPAFVTPGSDDLSDRIRMLRRLNVPGKAEILLDRVLEDAALNTAKRADALLRRAEIRAALGKFPEAHDDAVMAMEITAEDDAARTTVVMKLLQMKRDFPGFAAHVEANPKK